MKPFEKFLGKVREAAQLAQGADPLAATAVIEQALTAAGLMQPKQEPAARARPEAPELFDLNAPPEWAGKQARGRRTRRTGPEAPGRRPATPDPRAPGEFLQGSFSAEAGSLRYRLYIPARPATGPRPLLVMLHGCTQDAGDFAAGTDMNALAEEHGCLVLYPEQSRAANATLCWNWFEVLHQEREGGEPSLIAGVTREVIERWQGDPERVYVAGLSAGGAMAAIMAATHPELYAAVGVHSGLPVGKARDLITGLAAMKRKKGRAGAKSGPSQQSVPIIVFHGDSDEIVHSDNGDAVLEQFLPPASAGPLRRTRESGKAASGRAFSRTIVADKTGNGVAEHWELHGAGHAWSGGSTAGSYTDPGGPSASAEMLRFFLSQHRGHSN